MNPQPSTCDDFAAWLDLAREVEPLFGPMVADQQFREGLRNAMATGEAIGIRSADTLAGGIVVARAANEIHWLAVAQVCRGQGLGRLLLEAALATLDRTQAISVQTFAPDVAAGLPARKLYQAFGFKDSAAAGPNPAGIPTVIMVRAADNKSAGIGPHAPLPEDRRKSVMKPHRAAKATIRMGAAPYSS